MTDPNTIPANLHPEAALLPWYVNGTLREQDQQQVARHLETCAVCRAELEELSCMRTELRRIYDAQPGPSPRTSQAVRDLLNRDTLTQGKVLSVRRHWLETVDSWFRSLLMPRWAPTLLAIVLVAQLGVLLWTLTQPVPSDQVTSRSISPATARLRVTFQGQASATAIESLLHSIRGRIVDGPTADGMYTVEILADNESTLQKKLTDLQGHSEIVQSVGRVAP